MYTHILMETIKERVASGELDLDRLMIDACINGRMDIIRYYHKEGYALGRNHILESLINNNIDITEYIIKSNKKECNNTFSADMSKYTGFYLDSYEVEYFLDNYKGDNNRALILVNKYNICTMERYNILQAAVRFNCMTILINKEIYDTNRYDSLCILAAKVNNLTAIEFMFNRMNVPKYAHEMIMDAAIYKGNIDIMRYVRNNSRYVLTISNNTMCVHAANIGSLEILKKNITHTFDQVSDKVIFRVIRKRCYPMIEFLEKQYPIRNVNKMLSKFIEINDIVGVDCIYTDGIKSIHRVLNADLNTVKYLYNKGIKIENYLGQDIQIIDYLIKNGYPPNNVYCNYRNVKLAKYLHSIDPELVKGEYLNFMINKENKY